MHQNIQKNLQETFVISPILGLSRSANVLAVGSNQTTMMVLVTSLNIHVIIVEDFVVKSDVVKGVVMI